MSQEVEEEAAFKEMLITIVEHEVKVFFENEMWYWAARSVLALGDRMRQEILLLTIMKQKALSTGEHQAAGRLAIAVGNIALAEQIIRDLEKTIGEPYSDKAIVRVLTELPYTRTAKRVMRVFEDRGNYGQVLNIAAAIGDEETSERLLSQMINEGRLFPNTQAECLIKAVLFNPVVGKKLLKELEMPGERKEWYMECVGLVAAALGDTRYADNAFQYLKDGSSFGQLQAGKIAAALGKISDAEEMALRVYTPGSIAKHVEGDRLYSDSVGDIIGNVVKQSIDAAERIWGHVTRVEAAIGMPMIAVRVLERS